MFELTIDRGKLEFLTKWHSGLKENKINSKLVATSSYNLSTLIIVNCLAFAFLVNAIVLNGIFKTKREFLINFLINSNFVYYR